MSGRFVSLACLLVMAQASPAFTQEPDVYRIAAKVQVDGEMIGSPTMHVRSGESATLGTEGPAGYVLTAAASPVANAAPDQAKVIAELTLNSEPNTDPQKMTMVVKLGEPAKLEFVVGDNPVSFELTVNR